MRERELEMEAAEIEADREAMLADIQVHAKNRMCTEPDRPCRRRPL